MFYVLFFGHYPILAYLLERYASLFFAGYVNYASEIFVFADRAAVACILPVGGQYPLWAVWIVCLAVFVLFDVALTRLLGYYQFRIRQNSNDRSRAMSEFTHMTVFRNGEGGYSVYRIPRC